MSDELDELNSRIEVLAAEGQVVHDRLSRALAKRDQLLAKKGEPPRNCVIKFFVQFDQGGNVYPYVAYRAMTGAWYVTGKAKPMTWEELVRFMRLDITTRRADGEIRFFLFGAGKGQAGKWQGRKE